MEIAPTCVCEVFNIIEHPEKTPKVVIHHQKLNKDITLIGKTIDAQFCLGDRTILFLTEDCPFEEALHIYYLDSQFQLLDEIHLSAMYYAGIVDNVAVAHPNTITFSFFDKNEQWVLTIHETPRYRFLLHKWPVKRNIFLCKKPWLTLTRQ